jgi:cytochrome c biogenesis protein CcmG, thiol:disulfide interchange protein DsbE
MRQRLIFLFPVVAFAVILIGFAVALTKDPKILPSQLLDKPLPAFVLPTLTKPVTLVKSADLRGPMLLNIFASWCASCKDEHPLLMQLQRDKIVPLYGMDWKDKPEDGRAALQLNGNPYDIAFNDVSGRAGVDLGVTGVPETFVVDKEGRVRYRHVGPISPDHWNQIFEPLLAKLRRES